MKNFQFMLLLLFLGLIAVLLAFILVRLEGSNDKPAEYEIKNSVTEINPI